MGFTTLKCTNCGANIELDDSREFGFCTYCGTKVVQEKIVIEHQGSVALDTSNKVRNLKILAQRALESGDKAKARDYYTDILVDSPNDWEAVFYSVFLKNIDFAPMSKGYNNFYYQVNSAIEDSLKIIKENLAGSEQKDAYTKLSNEINDYVNVLLNFALESHDNAVNGLRKLSASDIRILTKQVGDGYTFAALIACSCAVSVDNYFQEETKLVTDLIFTGLRMYNCAYNWFNIGNNTNDSNTVTNAMITIIRLLEARNPDAVDTILEELPLRRG